MPVTTTTSTTSTSGVVAPPRALASAKVAPIAIPDLEQAFGWAAGSWQDQLLRAADAATPRHDGKISRAEIDAYLQKSPDLKFITSTSMVAIQNQVGGTQKAVDSFAPAQRNLAKAADANRDGTLTAAEMTQFITQTQASTTHTWIPDQQAAALESAVSLKTNEKDALNQVGVKGTSLSKDFMHVVQDDHRRDPAIVSYVLTPQDVAINTNPKRQDNFHGDVTDKAGTSMPSDYASAGYDQGHQKPADDSPNMDAMMESFVMTNMAPQTPGLNRMSWRVIETAVRQLVQATGAKATITTGSLFCDSTGKPLPDDQIKTIGPNKVQVPTYSFKTVLLEYPDGSKKTMAFMMPNRADLPSKNDDTMRQLIHGSMMPVSKIERLLDAQQGTPAGTIQLYPQLGAAGKALKAQPAATSMVVPNATKYPFANFLWPQPNVPVVTPEPTGGTTPSPTPGPAVPGTGTPH